MSDFDEIVKLSWRLNGDPLPPPPPRDPRKPEVVLVGEEAALQLGSLNGAYSIFVVDCDARQDMFRKSKLLFFHRDSQVYQIKIPKIYTFAIADDGTTVFGATKSYAKGHSMFLVVSPLGKILFERSYKSGTYSVGLSPSGRFAVHQSGSSYLKDSCMLLTYDTLLGEVLSDSKVDRLSDRYEWDEQGRKLTCFAGVVGLHMDL